MPSPTDTSDSPEPPAGLVDVSIVADYDSAPWQVTIGEDPPCETPCGKWIRETDSVHLRSRKGELVDVPAMMIEAPGAKRAIIVAEGRSRGEHAAGITFTTLGGMGAVIAITLTAVGCSNLEERRGMCTAGLIVGGISLPLMAASIFMIVDSAPKAHVLPVITVPRSDGKPAVSLAVTPTGVVGRF